MLTIWGHRQPAFCDRVPRRSFLKLGALGMGGLSLPSLLRAEEASGKRSTDQSVIMVFLPGGPPQHETFDPKPQAPIEIRGTLNPISTCLPGVQFCELLPELSRIADRFAVVRTLVGMQNRHESFQCYTGRPGGRNGDEEPAGGWPTFGSVVSQVLGPGREGMVPYIDAGPKMGYGPYNNRGQHDNSPRVSWPGFTGPHHVPFALDGEGRADLVLNSIDLSRLHLRRDLLTAFDGVQRIAEAAALDSAQQRAFGILTSPRLAEAMDLEREDARTRAWYGEEQPTDHAFGGAPQNPQLLLLARRLVEAGARCVTVAFGAWDWHGNRGGSIENLSRTYLPRFDHAIAVLLQDLEQCGLLPHVTVVVWGEFGRTPRINA
ncbi:MAG: DUF1501 domain-containing protein, partial [Planctomycetaceae bacterium]